MSPARARTRTACSGVERTNHEATVPPIVYLMVVIIIIIIKITIFIACDWFKKVLFSTNSLAKLLSDRLLLNSLLLDSLLSDSSISQSHSKM